MKYAITSKKQYYETMVAVSSLINKGEANLSVDELKKFAAMAKAAGKYEDEVMGLRPVI